MSKGRRHHRVIGSLLAAAAILGPGREARAGTTIDVVFRDSGSAALTIASPGGIHLADVVLTTSDDLLLASLSIGWDPGGGLSAASAVGWAGLAVGAHFFGPLAAPAVDNGAGRAGSFGGGIVLGNPPLLPQGTYRIGTLAWDASGASPGSHAIAPFLKAGLDTFQAGDNAGGILILLPPVLNGSMLVVLPEPGTAALLGLGLVGLVAASRRRRA